MKDITFKCFPPNNMPAPQWKGIGISNTIFHRHSLYPHPSTRSIAVHFGLAAAHAAASGEFRSQKRHGHMIFLCNSATTRAQPERPRRAGSTGGCAANPRCVSIFSITSAAQSLS